MGFLPEPQAGNLFEDYGEDLMAYRMPAEWEPHESTWLSWPTNLGTFGDNLQAVESVFAQMVEALQDGERVDLIVPGEDIEHRASDIIAEHGSIRNVRFHHQAVSDVWIRDYGPLFVYDDAGSLRMTKWRYNAYGGKYDDLAKDDQVFEALAPSLGFDPIRPGIILEGGSIDVNGKGTLLTSEQCLLNKNRNPDLTRARIEKHLDENLGARVIIWLDDGLEGDDTDGHVDDIARFVSEGKVLAAHEEDKSKPNFRELEGNLRILQLAKDQDGEALDVQTLPMPSPIRSPWGLLPGSYANFYIANRAVLLPVFGDANDHVAEAVLEGCFPEREIVPIDCRALIYGMGAIHCSTMQQPLRKRR
jgi:agmatine deiminase